ncbi:MAG TPA: GNAT family N-acetyltransferase [Dehalococcoidia bacterium]|nr:GNAT family N-acetyltransferase [Dehalococcoidia bacterium]
MTDSMFGAIAHDNSYEISETRDEEQLLQLLSPHRLFAAYALAQLEPDAFRYTQWWLSRHQGQISLVCHSRAGLGDATFSLGDPEGVAAILSIHPGQYQTFATAKPEHITALEEAYSLTGARTMLRMHVTPATFQPVAPPTDQDLSILRLRGHQVQTLNRLYGSEGGPTSYQGRHVDEGCYYGVVEKGRLVAVAGTHAISPSQRIAVVGNVFTHPQHRGHGLATLATSATTAELLRTCGDVVLSVDPNNTAAVRAYDNLGYVRAGDIVEAAARRRVGGLTVGFHRLLASFRGRRQHLEIVHR